MKCNIRLLVLMLLGILCLPDGSACRISYSKPLEDSMFAVTNAQRAKHGLRPLGLSTSARRVARRHSLDMFQRAFFGHINPDGWDLPERLRHAGVWYASSGENIARTLDIKSAHKGLMKSKKHRSNILGPSYTHIGIGIYKAPDGYLYITQNFIEAIDTVDAESAAVLIQNRLNKRRVNRKIPYLRRDSPIDSIAVRHSEEMLKTEKPDMPQDFGNIKTNARAFHFITPTLDRVFNDAELTRTPGRRIGIGVLQGNSDRYGNGLLWITIIVAE